MFQVWVAPIEWSKVRCQTAADIKAWLAEQASEGGPHFGLVYDVSHAHRQIPVVPSDWGRLACQLKGMAAETARLAREESAEEARRTRGAKKPSSRPSVAAFSEAQLKEVIRTNRVGTFGVSSAGYWWGRAGALLVRLTHYLTPPFLAVQLLLYADDGLATGRGSWFDGALLLPLINFGGFGLANSMVQGARRSPARLDRLLA